MKLNLTMKDVLQLSKAIKSGCLEIDKVECLNTLMQGYNPPKEVKESEMQYYLECIYKGWGIKPTPMIDWQAYVLGALPDDLMEKHQKALENGTIYKGFVKTVFWGLVALAGLGFSHTLPKTPNLDWLQDWQGKMPEFD